ncbi:BCL2/adenovirus E1B 19 kDa protein-interacting protein 3 isoform X1 [Pogona vitticeps]
MEPGSSPALTRKVPSLSASSRSPSLTFTATRQGSWVEVPPFGQEPPMLACAPCGGDLEAVLLEAQMEAERADGPLLALKVPAAEDLSVGQREDLESPVQRGVLAWPWSSAPEHLSSKESACISPVVTCPSLLSPALHRRRGLRDPQLLLLVIPSLLLSHVVALGLGICIGKRLATSSASSL